LCTGNHDWSSPEFNLVLGSIRLEDGSWVGARVTLSPGVALGRCAVAALGCVVTKSIPAYEVHAGNPARFTRYRQIVSRDVPVETSPTL
jgi:putative colanic acid biosynthesis acetyltransferase WcaF